MNESKQKTLTESGWKIRSVDEFLGIEKLDFRILPDDGMLESIIYNNNKVRIGHFHIFSNENFDVAAYVSPKYFEIKKDCKDIYEALDVANQWWNENRKLYLLNVENKPI